MAHAQAVDGQEQAGSGTVAAGTCSDAVPRGLPDHGDLDALCVVLGQPTAAAQLPPSLSPHESAWEPPPHGSVSGSRRTCAWLCRCGVVLVRELY